MIRAVIIDVDDTLCLTEAACFAMENEALRRMGRPPMSRALHIASWGVPLFDAIAMRSPGVDADAFRHVFGPTMKEYIDTGKLDVISPQNYDALDALIAEGKQVMLLTSREHVEMKHMLEPDHGLASRITAFYYRDNTQFHKPDPRVFNELLHAHSLQPQECVYVGDSVSDAAAAKEAGLHFIASLESGLRSREDFQKIPVDAFVQEFPGVVGAVAKLGAVQ
jgi:HAD superfamily hydrolase (TIGR01549 family)